MNEHEQTLSEVRSCVDTHPEKVTIEAYANVIRAMIKLHPEAARLSLALVGAEEAANP